MTTASDLYHRFEGYDELKPILAVSDEDVLVRLGRPALIRIPGTDQDARARLVSCLLHGNEDSGYRAVLEMLRAGTHYPFDLWVFIGNVRAASAQGWFAHRYLDDQEDFNRVWGLDAPTTRMRRCADAVLAEVTATPLEAAVDLHNNTGESPPFTVVPRPDPTALHLAALCTPTVLLWSLPAHTLMQALVARCPAVALECGLPGVPEHVAFAEDVLGRFLAEERFDAATRQPQQVFQMLHRVVVRPEVPFAFGGVLTDDVDLVLATGLDVSNFRMLLAGTEVGRIHPGAAMPLLATDMDGGDVTEHSFAVDAGGRLIVTRDLTPAMMTRTVQQARRDCLFYIARRRA